MSPRHLPVVTLLLMLLLAAMPARGQEMSTGGAITVPDGGQTPVPVRAVRAVGARAIDEKEISAVAQKAAEGKTGESARRAAVDAVRDLYRKRGYRMAQILQADLSADGTLKIEIVEGTIRRILIRGNSRTKSWAIRRTLAARPGDVYNEDRVRDDRNRLARLGIFEEVSITPRVAGTEDIGKPDSQSAPKNGAPALPPSPAPNPVAPPVDAAPAKVPEIADAALEPVGADVGDIDLVVQVKETMTVDVQASLGYSDDLGAVGFLNVTESNLAGTTQRIGVQWQRTAQATFRPDGSIESRDARAAFGFGYEVPPLGPRGYSFGIEAYDSDTVFLPLFAGVQDTLRSYEQRRGFRTRFGRQLTNLLALFATARRDHVGYENVPLALSPPLSELAASEGVVGALGFNAVVDGRDAADSPQRGYLHSLKFEHSSRIFGGTLPFTQTTVDLRQYVSLRKPDPKKVPPVLAGRLLVGISSDSTPLSEQYYLGGYETLRGYELFSIRGDRALLTEVEARFPLDSGLQAVGFVEYGGAWQPGEQFGLRGLNGDIGAGLRFATPIGPIRLDAAIGSGVHTYISLGQSF